MRDVRAQHRLRHNDDFRLTSKTGVRAAQSHVVAHLALVDSPQRPRVSKQPRVGFVVSKRVGNSVVRHRVKRRLRAIVADLIDQLPEYSTLVLRTQPGIDQLSHTELRTQVHTVITRACRALEARALNNGRPVRSEPRE